MAYRKTKLLQKIILAAAVFFAAAGIFASEEDLAEQFLEKAYEQYEQKNLEAAYKYVNSGLVFVNEESASYTKYQIIGKKIYLEKAEQLLENYDVNAYLDLQMNIEKYPFLAGAEIRKELKAIEQKAAGLNKAQEQVSIIKELETLEGKIDSAANTEEQQRLQKEVSDKMEQLTKAVNDFSDNSEKKNSEVKLLIGILCGILFLVFAGILFILVISKKNQKALKKLGSNQLKTNLLLSGNLTGLYGNSGVAMQLAGPENSIGSKMPELEISGEELKELQELAIECEKLGVQIDNITGRKNNSKNVSELVYKLSIQLGQPQGMALLNFCAAMVYDAGFLGIDPVLLKNTSLSGEQKKAMEQHVLLSEKYLGFVPKKYHSVFEDAATKHHENIDGSGYPKGLKGEEIPQIARLIRVSETYISISSQRSYRKTLDKVSAVAKLREQPELYDSTIVDLLEAII